MPGHRMEFVANRGRAGISVGPEGFADCGQKLFGARAQRFDAGLDRGCSWIDGKDGPAAFARSAEDQVGDPNRK